MKIIRLSALLILFLINAKFTNAQYGTIKGILTDKVNGEALVGANIFIEGTTIGAATNLDGKFQIEKIKPGIYNLSINSLGYLPEVFHDVEVIEHQITNIKRRAVRGGRTALELEAWIFSGVWILVPGVFVLRFTVLTMEK